MDLQTKYKIGLIHGILMTFVWVVAVPIAVAVPMYAKKKQKTWGAKVHMLIMATAAFLPFTISGIMIFVASGTLKLRPHSTIGTIITLGAWIQMILGIVNHGIYRYRLKHNCVPTSRPWNNSVHIWFGRILMIAALINIPLGMRIKKPGIALYVVYGVWLAMLAVGFAALVWMKPVQSQEQQDNLKTVQNEDGASTLGLDVESDMNKEPMELMDEKEYITETTKANRG